MFNISEIADDVLREAQLFVIKNGYKPTIVLGKKYFTSWEIIDDTYNRNLSKLYGFDCKVGNFQSGFILK